MPSSQAQLALAGINPAMAHEAQAVNTVKLNTRFTVVNRESAVFSLFCEHVF
jgi:hypothetical protein